MAPPSLFLFVSRLFSMPPISFELPDRSSGIPEPSFLPVQVKILFQFSLLHGGAEGQGMTGGQANSLGRHKPLLPTTKFGNQTPEYKTNRRSRPESPTTW
jgi:hypothetical protein